VRYKPYRVQRIRPLQTPPSDNVTVDALLVKMRELLVERVRLGLEFPPLLTPPSKPEISSALNLSAPKDVMHFLDSITDPEHVVDQVSCAVLPSAAERQTILETVSLEARLRRVIHFLLAEIRLKRKGNAA
jgi:hypothetical protein